MDYRFHTCDVFTDKMFGGNPLAVIPDARGLTEEQMISITREFNYSETTFVFPPTDPANTKRVRIFTPGKELQFAGHPTIGTAHVLAATGEVAMTGDETRIVFEEGVGPVPVTISARNGIPYFSQLTAAKLPEVGDPPPSVAVLCEILSLEPADIVSDDLMEPEAVSCGTPFLFIPVRTPEVLGRIKVNVQRWENTLKSYWAPEMFVFSTDKWPGIFDGGHIRARMFAPALGIGEDPATGSACAALAGFLGFRSEQREATLKWTVDQGVEMGRPSRLDLEVDLERGQVRAIRVGGSTVLVSTGVLHLPD
jgi:trans-2,3-dihydro-3-hydroxyanthranilate isomerase